jgi:uncharacterized BrkB/YihY/UPF0761 family membrane protein
MKRFLGFVQFTILAAPLLVWFPVPDLPPWEMWFDRFGIYFGMAMLASFTLFVILSVPSFLAGALNQISLLLGIPVMFALSFLTLTVFYAIGPSGPDWHWIMATSSFAAFLCVAAYALGAEAMAGVRLFRHRKKA